MKYVIKTDEISSYFYSDIMMNTMLMMIMVMW